MGKRSSRAALLWVIVAVQAVCTTFFIWDIAASVFGFESHPIPWEFRELIEMGAGLGLVLGVGVGALLLSRTLRRNAVMEDQIRLAKVAFSEMLEDRFTGWGLTPSERDVAWFTIKGFAIAEIARMRGTSEGTVKAQSNAIYRKAGVSGRTQLLSLFLEDLMGDAPPLATSLPAA